MEDRYLYRGKRTLTDNIWVYWDGVSGVQPNTVIEEETICQCTGLKDKNGKLVWENDIVEAWSQGSRAIGAVKQRVDGLWIMSPAWQNHEFWELKPNSNGETTVEILVNAFDNPELLQEVRQNEQS